MNVWEKRNATAALEKTGVAVVVKEYPGWRFWVGRECAWNDRHARAMARQMLKPEVREYVLRTQEPGYQATAEDDAIDRRMVLEAFAEGIVLDWEGVTGPNGKSLKFEPANVARVLQAFPDIYSVLRSAARSAVSFAPREAELEKVATGN